MPIIDEIDENRGEPLRAASIAAALREDAQLYERLCTVAAGIRVNFLTDTGWRFRVHDASLTFQQIRNRHHAVKILIDYNNELAAKSGVAHKPNSIVVGIELTHFNPMVRQALRDYLLEHFGEYYLDPRAPRRDSFHFISNDKYWIAPHNNHFYDIVFLPPGRLAFTAHPEAVADYKRRIAAGLGLTPP